MSRPFITPTVEVGEVEAGAAARARQELEALIASVNKSSFDIGVMCNTIKARGYYLPYTTFQEYAKTLTGLKPRKIQYLTRIAGVFEQVGIDRDAYEPLGIARCREITSLDPGTTWTNPETGVDTEINEFIRGFVEKGDEIEMDDLKRHIRTLKGFVGVNDIVWDNIPFIRSVYDNTWKPALEKAKALIGSVFKDDEGMSKDASDAAAAEVIATSFLNDPNVAFSQLGETYAEDAEEATTEEYNTYGLESHEAAKEDDDDIPF